MAIQGVSHVARTDSRHSGGGEGRREAGFSLKAWSCRQNQSACPRVMSPGSLGCFRPDVRAAIPCQVVFCCVRPIVVQIIPKESPVPHAKAPANSLRHRAPFSRELASRVDVLELWISWHQKHRVGGTHGRVRRDGSDGWRSPVPRGDNTGERDRALPPPTIACKSRRQVPNTVTDLSVDSVRDGWSCTSRRGAALRRHSGQPLRQRPSDLVLTLRRLRRCLLRQQLCVLPCGSGIRMLLAECDPFCAPQACGWWPL